MFNKNKEKTNKASESNGIAIAVKTLKYFMPIAWKTHKGYFFIRILKTIVNAVQPFVSIIFLPLIVAELLGGRNLEKLIFYTVVLAAGTGILTLANSLFSITIEKYAEKFNNYFSVEIGRRVMEMDFCHTEDKKALDQVEAAKTGMSWYSGGVDGICSPFFEIISNIITILGSAALIIVNAPILFFITAAVVAINVFITNKLNKIEIENYKALSKLNRVFGYYSFNLVDFRYGKDIRLYGAKDMMIEKWNSVTDEDIKHWDNMIDRQLPLNYISGGFGLAKDIASYLYLGILVLTGNISIPVFTQMLSAGSAFQNSMSEMMWRIQNIVMRTGYAYEYIKLMEYPAAITKGSRHVENAGHTIEFRNVSFAYPNTDVKVLNGVSLTLRQGEHLSVVGLNGAGKTTFIKLLCRLYDPTEGEILLDGINIKEYDYDEYISIFAPVFQDFRLFSFSIKENIVLDNLNNDQERVDGIIEQVGLKEKIGTLEKGVDTMLFKSFDENGIEPSGGEQQKIAIARALYKRAPVVILDEPTAALDPVAEYEIYRQFDTLVGGKTAIYISHRLSSCKFCDRIAVFSEGGIKEYGTHDELVEIDGGVYSEMFRAQARYYN